MDGVELRTLIYRRFAATGAAPTRREIIELVGSPSQADSLLHHLHDAHAIVLDDRHDRVGEVRMALPFSAIPTDYQVTTDIRSWWANCAWDSLAIAAAIHEDVHIASHWSDTGEALDFDVVDGRIRETEGWIHFLVPARHWWDDIVRT